MDTSQMFDAQKTLRDKYEKRNYETVSLKGRQDIFQRVSPKHISTLEKELKERIGGDVQTVNEKFSKEKAPEMLAYHMSANDTSVNSLVLLKIIDFDEGLMPKDLNWLKRNTDIPVEIYFFDDGEIREFYELEVN